MEAKEARIFSEASARSLARLSNGTRLKLTQDGGSSSRISLKETNQAFRKERRSLRRKVLLSCVLLLVLYFFSLGVMGAQGEFYLGSQPYKVFTPNQVWNVLYYHVYNAIAHATGAFEIYSQQWLLDNVPGYFAIPQRASVLGVTLLSAVLLAISGMLYQVTFKNPIAGPSILGVSSGVGLGVVVLVLVYGASAPLMVAQRYGLCYGFGATILVFVLLAARRLSKSQGSFDVVSLLLIGSIAGQLLGLLTSYFTLFVMDETTYAIYFEVSQMLLVDTSALSWTCLILVMAITITPIWLLRYRLNALAFDQDEVHLWGLNQARLRAIALIAGALMILAAQVHTGMVGLVSLVVPFLARRWFGCEFGKQMIGSACIGMVLLVICRTICDLIPFVGYGLAVGSIVSVVVLPLFLVVVARQQKGEGDF